MLINKQLDIIHEDIGLFTKKNFITLLFLKYNFNKKKNYTILNLLIHTFILSLQLVNLLKIFRNLIYNWLHFLMR